MSNVQAGSFSELGSGISGINIKLIDDEEMFRSLRSEWDELLLKSNSNTIFLTWEWLYSWWINFKKPNWKLHILLFKTNDTLWGIAPFYVSTIKTLKTLDVRKLYLVGYGSYDSEYLDLIYESGTEKVFFAELFNYLKRNKSLWDTLELNEVPENSTSHPLISQYVQQYKYPVTIKKHDCAYVQLPDNWDNFLSSMHYNFRKKLRHFIKRLENGHQVEFTQCPTKENLAGELESLFELHQKHWESEDHEGSFANTQRRKFYHDMANYFMEKNWLRLYTLKVDGQFTAHQYCFEYNDRMFSLQDGYDPDWGDKRVARILRGYVFRDLISRGVKEYDFLGGLSEYKKNWLAVGKYSVNTLIIQKNFKTLLHIRIPASIKKLRGRIKNSLPEKLVTWRDRRNENIRRKMARQKIDEKKNSHSDENSD